MPYVYAIGIGSNQPHGRIGTPRAVVAAAIGWLPGDLIAESAIIDSAPLGPSKRRYANAVALIEADLTPPALLAALKSMERDMGRKPGQRWSSRVLDLDILLWNGGIWTSPALSIPHPAFATRHFVIRPLAQIAPRWRDPLSGLTIRQLKARLDRPRPRD